MSRKDPDAPKKQGWFSQLRQVYVVTKANDPALGRWVFGAFLAVLVVAGVLGWLTGWWIYAIILGIPTAALAATVILSRRAERTAYRQIEGQPGAAGAALNALRKGWQVDQEPVAVEATRAADLSGAAMVFRAIGRPGVVLVAEGPTGRSRKLLAQERKRVERVAPGVPVHVMRVGDGEGDDVIELRKLTGHVQRMKPVLTKQEVAAVVKRLRALGGVRPPLPQGVDPTKVRMDRRALRGR